MDKHLDRLAKCSTLLTNLPARSHLFSFLLCLLPLVFSIALLAYSQTQAAYFPSTYTAWRTGLAAATLILCACSCAALHFRAPGSLRVVGWLFSVLGHYFFVLATVDAQYAHDACHPIGWQGPFCTTSGGTGAAQSLTTAAGLDVACLLIWLFFGGVMHQRGLRITQEVELAEAAEELANKPGMPAGAKTITIQVA